MVGVSKRVGVPGREQHISSVCALCMYVCMYVCVCAQHLRECVWHCTGALRPVFLHVYIQAVCMWSTSLPWQQFAVAVRTSKNPKPKLGLLGLQANPIVCGQCV